MQQHINHIVKKIGLLIFILASLIMKLSAENFHIENYSVHIDIYQDGYFDVLEVIDVSFTEKSRGIIRSIPYKHQLSNGQKVDIKLENIAVDDDPFKSYKEKGKQHIRIGDKDIFLEGAKTYSIKYRVYGAFSEYETHDEFYWNLIGTEWEVPIELVNFTIDVPEDYEMEGDFFGVQIADRKVADLGAEIWKSNERISGKTTGALKPKEGVTVGINFPKGYLDFSAIPAETQKEAEKKPWRDYAFPIPILLFGFFFRYWKKHGSNEELGLSNEAVYYPPKNIAPPEIGTFTDFVVHDHDVISLIPYWAQKGFITIETMEDEEMKITKVKDLGSSGESYENTLFDQIFEDENEVLLSDIKNQLYEEIGEIKEEIKAKVNNRSLYDEDAIKKFHSGKMIAAFVVALLLGVVLIGVFQFFATGALLVISGFIFLIFHFVQPKLSVEGVTLKHQINQFKMTLQNPDQKQLSKILKDDPKYFEKVFPYAVVFGLDDEFTTHFEPHLEQSPTWYVGGTQTNSFDHFKDNFDIQEVQQAFVMNPTKSNSSSGGGFSSGGSAGGGFGGGGGSSW